MSHPNDAYLNKIMQLSSDQEFKEVALEVFEYQYNHVSIYRKYCQLIGKTNPKSIVEIPFLPIELFKTHSVLADHKQYTTVFKSSGTTSQQRSAHYITDVNVYNSVSKKTFEDYFGPLEDYIIFALLPNYVDQGDSSLVFMVDHFVQLTQHEYSGFYLRNNKELISKIEQARQTGKKILLFGVSFALLELAEMHVNLKDIQVIETGGMKGKRQEMPKEALHELLKRGLNLETIYSEYGMTELLSQAYCKNDEPFKTPPWMKVLIRETNDPFAVHDLSSRKTGGINVIDLANIHSCAFVQTQDLGRYDVRNNENGFKLLGRYDHSDIRGCNQLIYI